MSNDRTSAIRAPGSRKVGLGFVDVAGSSIASFSLGIFATRYLVGERLGVYALFFTGFLLGAVVPTQLLCVPAEIEAVHRDPREQFRGLRSIAPWVLAVGALTAVLTTGVIAASVGGGRDGFVLLAATMIPTSALSPLQDHIRRLSHQANTSSVAATMSATQALVAGAALLALGRSHDLRPAAPFGALLIANIVSTALGLTLLRHRDLRTRGQRLDIARLASTGRWLTGAVASQALGGLGALLLISMLAGVTEAGLSEAVRVISQPVYVTSTGLLAVMNPTIFRARINGELQVEANVHRHYKVMLGVVSLLWVIGCSSANPWNPLPTVFPSAYEKKWLLEAVIVAQLLYYWPSTRVSSMLARGKIVEASVGQGSGFPLQIMLSATAAALGAWAYFFSLFGAAASRLLAIGTVERQARSPRLFDIAWIGRRREDLPMEYIHPIEEPSLVASVRRRLVVFFGCVGAGLAAGIVLVALTASNYVASTAVTVEDPRLTSLFPGSPNLDAKRYVADQVELLGSPAVLETAAQTLGSSGAFGEGNAAPTRQAVGDAVTIESSEASNTITVRYAGETEEQAAAGADAVLDAYMALATDANAAAVVATTTEIDGQLSQIDAQVATLDEEIAALSAAAPPTASPAGVEALLASRASLLTERASLSGRSRQLQVDLARNPSGVTRRSPTFTAAGSGGLARFPLAGAAAGAMLGALVCYQLARRRRRFEHPSEPEAMLGIRYLATLPAAAGAPAGSAPARQRESVLEFLATVIESEARRKGIRRFGFVSPSSSPELGSLGEGLHRMLATQRQPVDRVTRPARPAKELVIDTSDDGTAVPQRNGSKASHGEASESAGSGCSPLPPGGRNGNPGDAAKPVAGSTQEWTQRVQEGVAARSAALPKRTSVSSPAMAPTAANPVRPTAPAQRPTIQPATTNRNLPAQSLVLVEVPEFLDVGHDGARSEEIDAIVLVVDSTDSIASAAEVVRRVGVLGWEHLGYVYVTGRRST